MFSSFTVTRASTHPWSGQAGNSYIRAPIRPPQAGCIARELAPWPSFRLTQRARCLECWRQSHTLIFCSQKKVRSYSKQARCDSSNRSFASPLCPLSQCRVEGILERTRGWRLLAAIGEDFVCCTCGCGDERQEVPCRKRRYRQSPRYRQGNRQVSLLP